METKFTNKIANQVAQRSFEEVLDSIRGVTDPDYSVATKGEDVEDNFEEDLQEAGVAVTPARLRIVGEYFDKKMAKAKATLDKSLEKYYIR